jgi:hypothetical protein
MKADTILTIGVATVMIGVILSMNTTGLTFLPVPLVGLVIICIAIVKQNDEHRKW